MAAKAKRSKAVNVFSGGRDGFANGARNVKPKKASRSQGTRDKANSPPYAGLGGRGEPVRKGARSSESRGGR